MDKSPTYIRLCDKAEEIQCQWQRLHGDCFVGENGQIEYWISPTFDSRMMKRRFGIQPQGAVIRITKYIWLPRHDQLMELAQVPGKTFDSVTTDFFNWIHRPYPQSGLSPNKLFATLEQVWLAFVMHRKFSRIWQDAMWQRWVSRPNTDQEDHSLF